MDTQTIPDPGCRIPEVWADLPVHQVHDRTTVALMAVAAERGRQEQLCAMGRFAYTAATPTVSLSKKFPILVEEVGELAKELNEMPGPNATNEEWAAWYARTRCEAIQVAAVATALVESIDRRFETDFGRRESAADKAEREEP